MHFVDRLRTKTAERLDPSGDLALGGVAGSQLAPVADLHVVGGLNNVRNIVARENLEPE